MGPDENIYRIDWVSHLAGSHSIDILKERLGPEHDDDDDAVVGKRRLESL